MTLNDKLVSLIRTYVPYAIGAAVAWVLTTFAVDLSGATEAAIVAFSVAVVQNVYYLAVRLIESKVPAVGFLLGVDAIPGYDKVDDLWASVVRTGIPTLVGALVVTLLSGLWLNLDAASQTGLITGLTAVVQAAYYTVAVWVESKWPAAKVLLGNLAKPAYTAKHSATS